MSEELGSKLRILREVLEMTQEEIAERSIDKHGQTLRRIEIGAVELGKNHASTTRIRAGLARAFDTSEEELFDYLEGRTTLQEFLQLSGKAKKKRRAEASPPLERAIDLLVADGYGSQAEVRRAAAEAREHITPSEQQQFGAFEWAKQIEAALRYQRKAADPTATSGMTARASLKIGKRRSA